MLETLPALFTLTFVLASMFGMGLGVTPRDLVRPLRDVRFVLLALLANFGIVPATAWLLSGLLDEPLGIGLILAGAVAGAPFALKMADIAEADLRAALSLVVLLVCGTVLFLPLYLPRVLPDTAVDAGEVARQLGVQMLLPLAVGMLMRWRYPRAAEEIRPDALKLANLGLFLLLGVLLIRDTGKVLGLFGSGAVLSVLLLEAVALTSGWLLGGPSRGRRAALALGTLHRNYAAAFVVATGGFADDPDVLLMLAAASIVSLVTSFVVAGELRRRLERGAAPPIGPRVPN